MLSATPKDHIGSASGMFYTIYNVGRALSQTLAIMLIEFSIPPTIVSKAIIGIGYSNNLHVESALVHFIDSSFRFFTIFFVIALILGLVLLKSKEKNNVED